MEGVCTSVAPVAPVEDVDLGDVLGVVGLGVSECGTPRIGSCVSGPGTARRTRRLVLRLLSRAIVIVFPCFVHSECCNPSG